MPNAPYSMHACATCGDLCLTVPAYARCHPCAAPALCMEFNACTDTTGKHAIASAVDMPPKKTRSVSVSLSLSLLLSKDLSLNTEG